MLRGTHRDRLRDLIDEIMETSLPILCHDASGVPSMRAIDELRGELRDTLETEMALCAMRRNSRLPVHALPTDVLRRIAARSAFNARANAVLVCSRWRTALVGAQSLWRNAVLFWNGGQLDATSAAAVVRRAGGTLASLVVQSPLELVGDPLSAPIISTVLGQLRHLTVDLEPTAHGAWAQILASPAPELQTLRVRRYALLSVYILPQSLFGGTSPKLRTVLLHCCLTPPAPCPAFKNVTMLGYFCLASLDSSEVMKAMVLAPRLERLIVSAWSYDTGTEYGGWTISTALRSLSVQKIVGDGVFHALALRVPSLVVCNPVPLYSDTLVLRCMPLTRIAVHWIGASDRLSVAIASNGAECVLARVNEPFVTAFLERNLARLLNAAHLLLPDSFWLKLCALAAPPAWPALVHLTLHLVHSDPSATAQYRHMFVLQNVTLAEACPQLETVHLVHTGCRGSAVGEYLRVSAERVTSWLPATVSFLNTSGIVLSDPGLDVLLAKVVHKSIPEPKELYTLEDENEREWAFPLEDALQL